MDYYDLHSKRAQIIINELNELILILYKKNLKISSWYGQFELSGEPDAFEVINRGLNYNALPNAADDKNFPWFLYWEIVWVVLNNPFHPGQEVLDLGGSSSLFSYYLASKGLKVTTVDQSKALVTNADHVKDAMGWNIVNLCMDIRELSIRHQFDHITSICVFEHIPMFDRIEINKHIKSILKENGSFSLTFDYRNPSNAARISSPEDIESQFILPSKMKIRGNRYFFDNSKNYLLHPFFSQLTPETSKRHAVEKGHFDHSLLGCTKETNDYTFGALFLQNC